MKVDLDNDIQPTLYRVVAELLAWLYHINAEKSGNSAETSSTYAIAENNFDKNN